MCTDWSGRRGNSDPSLPRRLPGLTRAYSLRPSARSAPSSLPRAVGNTGRPEGQVGEGCDTRGAREERDPYRLSDFGPPRVHTVLSWVCLCLLLPLSSSTLPPFLTSRYPSESCPHRDRVVTREVTLWCAPEAVDGDRGVPSLTPVGSVSTGLRMWESRVGKVGTVSSE